MATEQVPVLVRINQIDSTVVKAGPLDDSALPQAPVLRVYGVSSLGSKVCLYIHKVYPYFFVEYTGRTDPVSVNRYINKLICSLNYAVALSLKRNPNSPNSKFIRAIILVKGVHFYGFHSSYSPFLKILVNDPAYVQRVVTIMQSGSVMTTHFRTFESHLSYILQFLCDFGLYGCGWIEFSEAWKRGDDQIDGGENSNINATAGRFKPSPYFRQSRMPLELDTIAYHIVNRHNLTARNLHHQLKVPGPPLPDEPLVLSVRELWEDERRRRIARGLSPSPVTPKTIDAQSRQSDVHWVAEARWWEEIRKRIEKERDQEVPIPNDEEWQQWVMTTFESVQALWDRPWRTWKPDIARDISHHLEGDRIEANPYSSPPPLVDARRAGTEDLDVDESVLSSQDISRLEELDDLRWDPAEDIRQEREDAKIFDEDFLDDQKQAEEMTAEISSPAKSETRTPIKDAVHDSTSPFQRAWAKLTSGPSQSYFPSVTSEIDSSSRMRKRVPPPAIPMSVEDAAGPSKTRPVVDASPDNPFLDRTFRMVAGSSVPPEKNQFLREQLEGSINRRKYHASLDQALQESSAASEDESDSGTMHIDDQRLQSDSLHELDQDFERVKNNDDVERDRKRIKLMLDHEDKSIFTPQKEQTADILATPRYTKSNNQITSSYASLSQDLMDMSNCYEYTPKPPSASDVVSSFELYGLPNKIYRSPYYSVEDDAPEHPREYAGLVYHLQGGEGTAMLQDWMDTLTHQGLHIAPQFERASGPESNIWGWEYASVPPSRKEVKHWLRDEIVPAVKATPRDASQIEGPTQANVYGMQPTIAPQHAVSLREKGNMEVLALEVFAPSREGKLPDPGQDEVIAVFWSFYDSDSPNVDGNLAMVCQTGIIAVDTPQINPQRIRGFQLDIVYTELELLNRVVDVVQDLDPDIVTGWDVQTSSWGYLNVRAKTYEFDFGEHVSRAPGRTSSGGVDQWGLQKTSTFKVIGRHVFNLWRIIRAEQDFTTYSFEYAVFQLLRRRIPHYSARTLTSWYYSNVPEHVSRLLRYFAQRTFMVLEVIDVAQIVTKTAEFARVFGVDFFSVISRGSQFKVESFMFRIAKPESFVLLSPSRQDVGKQNAAECMPLIMEPLSAFYNSPLVVLDFQSLYPSVMIAYNYCYSTCVGRIIDFKGQNKFGVTELRQPPGLLDSLKNHINVAPNGLVYVKSEVRKGLLGRMLSELLDTRVMVKQAMKGVKDDKAMTRILNARQLGLKYIANVTYGYTSATFSGRMPAVEIADSIVQTGRETLEKAIRVIDSTRKWGARVVYGDTDSVFVYLRGKTKEQAFRIGQDMADAITAMNPAPVKLRFEKVYLPCVLLAKKRYVGFKFESPDEEEPVFDAKGIETVRRDGVPAQQKMVETCLKILFRTQDLSRVKDYCCSMWGRMLENRASLRDFIFAKEVRMGTYSDKVPPPPGVAVAARHMVEDQGYEPQYGERVPYVIIRGQPLQRLVDRAVSPEEVLNDSHKYIDASYYISRVLIPPLERIFNLMGADVRSWYDEMPKVLRADQPDAKLLSPRKPLTYEMANRLNIDEHFLSSRCLTCGQLTIHGVCLKCREDQEATIVALLGRVRKTETRLKDVQAICSSCAGTAAAEPVQCESLDCPWLFERKKLEHKTEALGVIDDYIEEIQEGIYLCSESDDQEEFEALSAENEFEEYEENDSNSDGTIQYV